VNVADGNGSAHFVNLRSTSFLSFTLKQMSLPHETIASTHLYCRICFDFAKGKWALSTEVAEPELKDGKTKI